MNMRPDTVRSIADNDQVDGALSHAVADMRPGWIMLRDCALTGGDPNVPVRIRYALLHPEIGIALLDLLPDATMQCAPDRLRVLNAEAFPVGLGEYVPVVHLCMAQRTLSDLGWLLTREFGSMPRLALPCQDTWTSAVQRVFAAWPPLAAPGHLAAEGRPPSGPPAGWKRVASQLPDRRDFTMRSLAVFWSMVAVTFGGGGLLLHHLGPPQDLGAVARTGDDPAVASNGDHAPQGTPSGWPTSAAAATPYPNWARLAAPRPVPPQSTEQAPTRPAAASAATRAIAATREVEGAEGPGSGPGRDHSVPSAITAQGGLEGPPVPGARTTTNPARAENASAGMRPLDSSTGQVRAGLRTETPADTALSARSVAAERAPITEADASSHGAYPPFFQAMERVVAESRSEGVFAPTVDNTAAAAAGASEAAVPADATGAPDESASTPLSNPPFVRSGASGIKVCGPEEPMDAARRAASTVQADCAAPATPRGFTAWGATFATTDAIGKSSELGWADKSSEQETPGGPLPGTVLATVPDPAAAGLVAAADTAQSATAPAPADTGAVQPHAASEPATPQFAAPGGNSPDDGSVASRPEEPGTPAGVALIAPGAIRAGGAAINAAPGPKSGASAAEVTMPPRAAVERAPATGRPAGPSSRTARAAKGDSPSPDVRCRTIVLMAQLGEETSRTDHSYLRTGCHARR